jgi:hypothetical protein
VDLADVWCEAVDWMRWVQGGFGSKMRLQYSHSRTAISATPLL